MPNGQPRFYSGEHDGEQYDHAIDMPALNLQEKIEHIEDILFDETTEKIDSQIKQRKTWSQVERDETPYEAIKVTIIYDSAKYYLVTPPKPAKSGPMNTLRKVLDKAEDGFYNVPISLQVLIKNGGYQQNSNPYAPGFLGFIPLSDITGETPKLNPKKDKNFVFSKNNTGSIQRHASKMLMQKIRDFKSRGEEFLPRHCEGPEMRSMYYRRLKRHFEHKYLVEQKDHARTKELKDEAQEQLALYIRRFGVQDFSKDEKESARSEIELKKQNIGDDKLVDDMCKGNDLEEEKENQVLDVLIPVEDDQDVNFSVEIGGRGARDQEVDLFYS